MMRRKALIWSEKGLSKPTSLFPGENIITSDGKLVPIKEIVDCGVRTTYRVILANGMRTDSSWTAKSFTCVSDMLIGSTSVGATSAKFTGTMYGNIEVVGRAVFIPVERISDGEIGYYEAYSGAFLTNQLSGTPSVLGYA